MTSILVVNNFGQFAHLIHRAVRDLDVDCELVKNTLDVDELLRRDPDGLILSGGPSMDRIENFKLYVRDKLAYLRNLFRPSANSRNFWWHRQ